MPDKTPFIICAVKKAILSNKNGVTILEAFLNKKDFIDPRPLDSHGMSLNPWIIALTDRKNPAKNFVKKQLKLFNKTATAIIADDTHPVRWCGSGAVLIIEDKLHKKYLVVNKRHPKSAWGNNFDAYGGYSSGEADMLNPVKLGARELSEEIKFNIQKKPKILKSKIKSKIIIHFQNKKFIYPGLNIVIDRDTGTIDFRAVALLKVDSIDNLKIFDQETIFTGKTTQGRQKRPIFLYDFNDIKNLIDKKKKFAFPAKGFYENNVIDTNYLKEYKISLSVMTPALFTTLKNAIDF